MKGHLSVIEGYRSGNEYWRGFFADSKQIYLTIKRKSLGSPELYRDKKCAPTLIARPV